MGLHKNPALIERNQKMLSMFQQGVTLEKIGQQFGVTRERVRQILTRQGIDKNAGGQRLVSAMKKERKSQAFAAKIMAKYGLPWEVVQELQKARVTHAFGSQRNHAKMRGIGWELDFATWFAIWQTSGKLHLRGRGHGKYVMSRIRDDGPYAIGNVHIQLATENNREAVDKWRGKTKENRGVFCLYPGRPKAWLATVARRRIGFFETEQEAVEAREAELTRTGANPGGLGGGRGWSYRSEARHAKKPYVMQCGGVKKTFATQAEAEAAYKATAAELIAARKQVSEPIKGGGVNVDHGAHFSPSEPINANQLCGDVL